jgi:hypothetical protein
MSDGPHKSLPMRPAWKKLAERADTPAFEQEQVTQSLAPALEDDWREAQCPDLVRNVREVLGDVRQGSLFSNQKASELEAAKKQLAAGSPLRRLVVEHIIRALANGLQGEAALEAGVASALRDGAARGRYQVEEHFHRRSTEKRATKVGKRIEGAMTGCDFGALAKRFTGNSTGGPGRPAKQQELDDGVRLP